MPILRLSKLSLISAVMLIASALTAHAQYPSPTYQNLTVLGTFNPAGGCGLTPCSIPVYPAGRPYGQYVLAVGLDGNIYVSQVANNTTSPTAATECGTNWKPFSITISTTVNVPAKCATIQTAVTFLVKSVAAMAKSATGTIQVADGTQTPTGPINLDSPFGRQFSIVGNTTTPASSIISYAGFTTTPSAVRGLFELTGGNGFGLIDGFAYQGPTNSVCTPNCQTASTGYAGSIFVYAAGSGATVTVGPHVTMAGGYSGVLGSYGAFVYADGTKCTGGADGCYWLYHAGGSFVGADASASATPQVFSGSGFLVDQDSYAYMDNACSWSNAAGISVFNNSAIHTAGMRLGRDCSGAVHANTQDLIRTNGSYLWDEGNFTSIGSTRNIYRNPVDGTFYDDVTGITLGAEVSGGNYASHVIQNGNSNPLFIAINKAGSVPFSGEPSDTASIAYLSSPLTICDGNTKRAWCSTAGNVFQFRQPYTIGTTTFTLSGCSATAPVGHGASGTFVSGTTGTCTVVITFNGAVGMTAPNGWYCPPANDLTTPADSMHQTASSVTTATLAGTTVSGDTINFGCTPY